MPGPNKALGRETRQAIFTLRELAVRGKGILLVSGRRQAGGHREGPLEVRKSFEDLPVTWPDWNSVEKQKKSPGTWCRLA